MLQGRPGPFVMAIQSGDQLLPGQHIIGSLRKPGSAREGSGIRVYPKKLAKIPQNTQNSSKYTQNYTQVYFMPEIQRKWYTEYPYLSCNIPYTRFKKPLYTVYPKTLADPGKRRWRRSNSKRFFKQNNSSVRAAHYFLYSSLCHHSRLWREIPSCGVSWKSLLINLGSVSNNNSRELNTRTIDTLNDLK